MFIRQLEREASHLLTQFRALCITGPRQSGKTTLSRTLFRNKPYVNFEELAAQMAFESDPQTFIDHYREGAIFDEVQRVPLLFRHLQVSLDRRRERGQFILTGSNNLLLAEQVSQSLAGRAGYIALLPLSYGELKQGGAETDLEKHIISGGYPEIWDEQLDPSKWHASYIQTYVQRDVRQLKNITNLQAFTRLVQLCATHAGQIVNRDELARQVGVDTKTIQSWLGLLEASYIIFLLQPWHRNLNKRIIKSPKLYFHDTGLLTSLLNIRSATALKKHPQYGGIFENWCVAEVMKNQLNRGEPARLFFLRDNAGNEIDVVLEREDGPFAIEIKSSAKREVGHLRAIRYWQKNQPGMGSAVIYTGSAEHPIDERSAYLPWTEIDRV